jgi:hypothetical protein
MYTVEVKDMVSSDAAPGVQPSHKITYTDGSDQFWFYYFMRTPECRPFIRMKDDELVKHMYPKGVALKIEGFLSFNLGGLGDFHLQRLSSHVFTIAALK